MKKLIFIGASLIIVLACFSVAVLEYNNHKVKQQVAVNSAVKQANDTLKKHDAVNAKALTNVNNALAESNAKRAALCAILKPTKVAYDPANCQ